MNNEQALYNFWSSFNVPAFEENSVPSGTEFPYITYEFLQSSFLNGEVIQTVSLWYRSTSWKEISEKKDEISKAIGISGKILKVDDGIMFLKKGNPFATATGDTEDDKIKRYLLNIEIEYITEN